MKHRNTVIHMSLILVGLICMSFGVFLYFSASTEAQDRVENTSNGAYVSSNECRDCHRDTYQAFQTSAHDLALFDPTEEEYSSYILGDFSMEDPLLSIALPGETAPRQITQSDIALVIGRGKEVQQYAVAVAEDAYRVLPFEWDVETASWQPLSLGGEWASDPVYDFNTMCAGCHVTGYDPETLTWEEAGASCETCHGPAEAHVDAVDDAGRDISEDEMQEIVTAINVGLDPQVCGQCHSQGLTPEGHPFPVSYQPGDDLLAGFSLVPLSDDTHWWNSGHAKQANMQYNEWLNSAHGNNIDYLRTAVGAEDSCLNCHSADITINTEIALEDVQYGVTCASCHDAHGEANLPNLLRAEADTLCQSCHSNDQLDSIHHPTTEMLSGDSLIDGVEGVASGHSTAEDGPTCISCHMMSQPAGAGQRISHSFTPVMPGAADAVQSDTCTACHTDLTRSYSQRFIDKQQTDVSGRIERIETELAQADPVSSTVTEALAFIQGDGSLGVHNVAYTERLLNMIEVELGLRSTSQLVDTNQAISNPQECAECHADEHQEWSESIHATTSLQEQFRLIYAENGQPGFCLSCHASGYDPQTQTYAYAGVVCSNCHTMDGEHPPAPVSVDVDSSVCATCHSGGHASTYEEWLASEHNAAGVDCVDCHKAHSNSLILDDVNSTCSDCHANAMEDEVHMGEDMICTDCHMTPRTDVSDPTMLALTGHSMKIDPSVCADCHGYTHALTLRESGDSAVHLQTISDLNQQIANLETEADDNRMSGLLGGAVGVLLLLGLVYLILRLWRL